MSYFQAIARDEAPAAPVWLPFLETLAARMDGCEPAVLIADATRWANALPRAAKLLDAPVVAVGFIDGLGLDAFAAEAAEPWRHPSLATLLDCAGRLADTLRPGRELAVAVPGPLRLLRHLGLAPDRAGIERLKPGLVGLLERLGEKRPELIVLNETGEAPDALAGADYRRLCNTLKNVTEYFGIGLGLRVDGAADGPALIGALRPLRLDHLLLGAPVPEAVTAVAAAAGQGWRSLGLPLAEAGPALALRLSQADTACYWCSPGQETDLERARQIAQALTH